MNNITASPLYWPAGWKRTAIEQSSRFGKHNKPVSIAKATTFILDELKRMGVDIDDVIISTNLILRVDGLPRSNQVNPADKGCSVWWKDKGKDMVLALDKYDRVACNLYAIGKTIESMRGIERWGSGEILERSFAGFKALPSPDKISTKGWRDVLDYWGESIKEANKFYKLARSKAHPDRGGSDEKYFIVNQAWAMAETELKQLSLKLK